MSKENTRERFQDFLIERLRDKELAKAYLDAALEEFIEDPNKASFLRALHDIAMAQGGLSKLSQKNLIK